jgi:hypothetical protein
MAYTINQQYALDIDWYFLDWLGNIIHITSAGGRLPNYIAERDKDNESLNAYFRGLRMNFEVTRNPLLEEFVELEELGIEEDGKLPLERYEEDFISMAKRGLYSYDKTILGNFDDTQYHLVAKPSTNPKLLDLLPINIRLLLYQPNNRRVSGEFNIIDIGLFDGDNIPEKIT